MRTAADGWSGPAGAVRPDPEVVPLAYAGYSTGPGPTTTVANSVRVQEVDFVGDTVIPVLADPGRTPYPTGVEWRDENLNGVIEDSVDANAQPKEWAVPVAFVRNTVPVVTAKFKVMDTREVPAGTQNTVTIQGLWQGDGGGLNLKAQTLPVEGGYVIYPPTPTGDPGPTPVPNYVGSVSEASITWQFKAPRDGDWHQAGISSNQVYATLAKPVGTTYHIFLELSTAPSWGATKPDQVVDGTYKAFQTQNVQAVKPAYAPPGSLSDVVYKKSAQPLHYYENWRTGVLDADGLLDTGDGQCSSWVLLFALTGPDKTA